MKRVYLTPAEAEAMRRQMADKVTWFTPTDPDAFRKLMAEDGIEYFIREPEPKPVATP